MSSLTDVLTLTKAIRRGENAAFGEFYEAWFDRLYAKARRISGRDEGFCLDVVQDALLRVVRAIPPMRTEADLERWMSRVLHSALLDRLKADRRRRNREQDAGMERMDPPEEDPAAAMEHEERITRVQAVLATLSEEDRTLIESRFGKGVWVSSHAAHGRLRRLLGALKERFNDAF